MRQDEKSAGRLGNLKKNSIIAHSNNCPMNRNFPLHFQYTHCVSPTGWVGFTQLLCTPMVSGSCVKPTYPEGFTQLAGAGIWATKRVFTQLGLIGGVDEKP